MFSRQIVLGALFAHQTLALPISPYTTRRATGFDNRKEANFEPIDQRELLHPFVLTALYIPGRNFLQPSIRSDHRHLYPIHVWRVGEYLRRGPDSRGQMRKPHRPVLHLVV